MSKNWYSEEESPEERKARKSVQRKQKRRDRHQYKQSLHELTQEYNIRKNIKNEDQEPYE
jgi:hypothetical protein